MRTPRTWRRRLEHFMTHVPRHRCNDNTPVYMTTTHSQIIMHHSAWRAKTSANTLLSCNLRSRRSRRSRSRSRVRLPQPACSSQHPPGQRSHHRQQQPSSSVLLPLPHPLQLHHSVHSPPLKGHCGMQHVQKHVCYTPMRACTENPSNRLYSCRGTCRGSQGPAPTLLEHSQERSDRARLIILL
jgi:hypothetical protein